MRRFYGEIELEEDRLYKVITVRACTLKGAITRIMKKPIGHAIC